MKLTAEQSKEFDHISTDEIMKGITDTQSEIDQFQKELDVLIQNRQHNNLAIYINTGWMLKREEFIERLESILEYRHNINLKPQP
ncbi:MAG TPA: hypothetical protein VJN02_07935 [Gammaproteobacteria bacterium]|nr:hypothetical protein [Gammaproteobacteria bacterium]